jgi:hypothetical protein
LGTKDADIRKLLAAAQEERRRQGIGLRQADPIYDAIAVQVGLTQTGVPDTSGVRRQCFPARRSSLHRAWKA